MGYIQTKQEKIDELTKELESYKYSLKILCELYFEVKN